MSAERIGARCEALRAHARPPGQWWGGGTAGAAAGLAGDGRPATGAVLVAGVALSFHLSNLQHNCTVPTTFRMHLVRFCLARTITCGRRQHRIAKAQQARRWTRFSDLERRNDCRKLVARNHRVLSGCEDRIAGFASTPNTTSATWAPAFIRLQSCVSCDNILFLEHT